MAPPLGVVLDLPLALLLPLPLPPLVTDSFLESFFNVFDVVVVFDFLSLNKGPGDLPRLAVRARLSEPLPASGVLLTFFDDRLEARRDDVLFAGGSGVAALFAALLSEDEVVEEEVLVALSAPPDMRKRSCCLSVIRVKSIVPSAALG